MIGDRLNLVIGIKPAGSPLGNLGQHLSWSVNGRSGRVIIVLNLLDRNRNPQALQSRVIPVDPLIIVLSFHG